MKSSAWRMGHFDSADEALKFAEDAMRQGAAAIADARINTLYREAEAWTRIAMAHLRAIEVDKDGSSA